MSRPPLPRRTCECWEPTCASCCQWHDDSPAPEDFFMKFVVAMEWNIETGNSGVAKLKDVEFHPPPNFQNQWTCSTPQRICVSPSYSPMISPWAGGGRTQRGIRIQRMRPSGNLQRNLRSTHASRRRRSLLGDRPGQIIPSPDVPRSSYRPASPQGGVAAGPKSPVTNPRLVLPEIA